MKQDYVKCLIRPRLRLRVSMLNLSGSPQLKVPTSSKNCANLRKNFQIRTLPIIAIKFHPSVDYDEKCCRRIVLSHDQLMWPQHDGCRRRDNVLQSPASVPEIRRRG